MAWIATGTGFPTILRSGAQAISHAKCTSSNVDTAETACSLYYYIFSWPGCPTSQPVTASNPYLTANQSILSTIARSAVARSGQLCCHCPINKLSWIAALLASLTLGSACQVTRTTRYYSHTQNYCLLLQNNTCTYFLPVIYHCH